MKWECLGAPAKYSMQLTALRTAADVGSYAAQLGGF